MKRLLLVVLLSLLVAINALSAKDKKDQAAVHDALSAYEVELESQMAFNKYFSIENAIIVLDQNGNEILRVNKENWQEDNVPVQSKNIIRKADLLMEMSGDIYMLIEK